MSRAPDDLPLPGGRNTIERLARFGYGARGVVYGLVGALALLAAFGGGRPGDSHDALRTLLVGPFGAPLVGLNAARGVAFLIIGGFLAAAAWYQSSAEAKGLGDAFALLRAQPYGAALLALVAAGHMAFGAFGLIQARYRHIDAPDVDRVDDEAAAAVRKLA